MISLYKKLYRTIDKPTLKLRKIEEKDISICCTKLNEYLSKFKVRRLFTEDEFKQHFINNEKIVETYVVESETSITDFVSFYHLKTRVLKNDKFINRIYLYYYFSDNLKNLINNILLLGKNNNIDELIALDILDNNSIFDELKFIKGSGALGYYLYNWSCPSFEPKENSFIVV